MESKKIKGKWNVMRLAYNRDLQRPGRGTVFTQFSRLTSSVMGFLTGMRIGLDRGIDLDRDRIGIDWAGTGLRKQNSKNAENQLKILRNMFICK